MRLDSENIFNSIWEKAMGVSTNAILAFGFDLGEYEDLPEAFQNDDGDSSGLDFEEWVMEKAGVIYPDGHSGISSPEYRAYHDASKAAINACPVDIVSHCSYDYPMYFLAIRGTEKTACRGFPESVELTPIEQERIDAMRQFCDDHGIEWQEPKWHIFSMWG